MNQEYDNRTIMNQEFQKLQAKLHAFLLDEWTVDSIVIGLSNSNLSDEDKVAALKSIVESFMKD